MTPWLTLVGIGEDGFSGKPGLDIFYSVTPSLRLTATINTDFGETEVDARQINLTQWFGFNSNSSAVCMGDKTVVFKLVRP